MATKAVAII